MGAFQHRSGLQLAFSTGLERNILLFLFIPIFPSTIETIFSCISPQNTDMLSLIVVHPYFLYLFMIVLASTLYQNLFNKVPYFHISLKGFLLITLPDFFLFIPILWIKVNFAYLVFLPQSSP